MTKTRILATALVLIAAAAALQAQTASAPAAAATVHTPPGVMPVPDPKNLYSETAAGKMSPNVAGALERIYVPNHKAHTVSVIDPATLKVTHTFKVGLYPQHVVPSWDLKTLYVANNAENSDKGSLTEIDPKTGKTGRTIPVDDPYNMYWTPDGKHAIVVAEAFKRLDFRDPVTMKLDFSLATPDCDGINHADFSIDSRHAFFTCEFNGAVTKIDLVNRKVLGTLKLSRYFDRPDALALIKTSLKTPKFVPDPKQPGAEICITPGMPQDVRFSPDGKTLYVADMMADGVHVVDPEGFKQYAFIPTGVGAHGLYPSRDAKQLYVANRGSNYVHGQRVGDRFRQRQGAEDLAGARRRQPRHGQRQCRRQIPLAFRPLRRRGLPLRHHQRRGRLRGRGQAAARPGGVAAARALQPGAHRQPALIHHCNCGV
jgi:YVTN family beta-propeller protein